MCQIICKLTLVLCLGVVCMLHIRTIQMFIRISIKMNHLAEIYEHAEATAVSLPTTLPPEAAFSVANVPSAATGIFWKSSLESNSSTSSGCSEPQENTLVKLHNNKYQFQNMLFIHVGKCGGVTLRSVLKTGCALIVDTPKMRLCLSQIPESRLSEVVTSAVHCNNVPKGGLSKGYAQADSFLFILRHPLDRTISWYNYVHPALCKFRGTTNCVTKHEVMANPDGLASKFFACFPQIEDWVRALRQGYSNASECSELALKMTKGDVPRREGFSAHMYYNIRLYANRTTLRYPKKPVIVVRTESLWEDAKEIDLSLGGNGTFGQTEGSKFTHGSETITTPQMSRLLLEDIKVLCCGLIDEMEIYRALLVKRAVNLVKASAQETWQGAIERCGASSWTELKAECAREKAMQLKAEYVREKPVQETLLYQKYDSLDVMLIPSEPDTIPLKKIRYAMQLANITGTIRDSLRACRVTSQIRLYMKAGRRGKWYLQTLDSFGKDKLTGGDEFHVTFHSASKCDDMRQHPTVTANVKDFGNGTYELDFVTTPMFPDYDFNPISDTGGNVTVHFVFTCGIGNLPPPTKKAWDNGGYTHTHYSVAVPKAPPIRVFEPPARVVDFSGFDHVLLVGDSVMQQFAQHNRQYFRPNVSMSTNIGRPLTTATVADFVSLVVKSIRKTLDAQPAGLPKILLILGSSTWDILDDDTGQGTDFADHQKACRTLIALIGNLTLNTPVTTVWKSPTAVHPHVVINRRTKWFGPIAAATQRIKYMSAGRAGALYKKQKAIMAELQVPFLDVYEATYLSADWHFPTDGRHYTPQLNQAMFNWFYSQPAPNLAVDYSYSGYG
jgi:hypothetical protein